MRASHQTGKRMCGGRRGLTAGYVSLFLTAGQILYILKIIIFVHSEHSVRLAISTASAPRQAYERKRKTETETYNPKQS
jgi:hypothetical protein